VSAPANTASAPGSPATINPAMHTPEQSGAVRNWPSARLHAPGAAAVSASPAVAIASSTLAISRGPTQVEGHTGRDLADREAKMPIAVAAARPAPDTPNSPITPPAITAGTGRVPIG
jgi:hypothetical protein